jgi:hypothetical protein
MASYFLDSHFRGRDIKGVPSPGGGFGTAVPSRKKRGEVLHLVTCYHMLK